ncbi:MAG: cysteine desulfurase [Bacteroidales bacterium]|nr:cysteine desulfurase [Bacteroidales bacterium]MBD5343494.1 cysteine desulfurase [Bacteroides sp.]
MYDIAKIRSEFPALDREVNGRPLVYLDNTATSQTPRCVVDAITAGYYHSKANVHRGVHTLSVEATQLLEASRRSVKDFINAAEPEEIIFTRGTTEALNLVASSLGGMLLGEGDELILTDMEHHSNIVPWQLLQQRKGFTIKVVPVTADGSLDMEALRSLISPRTRLISVCHASNVLGTVNPIAEITALAHSHGIPVVVDGAQAVPHLTIDVQALGADFYAFSAHKMYGPTGVGVLYGRRELLEKMPPYQGGGEMIESVSWQKTTFAALPYKFEAGTPDFVGIAAFARAIDYMRSLGIADIAAHEHELMEYTTRRMMEIPGMRIFGTAPGKCAIISFLVGHIHHYDMGMLLDQLGVAVRTGHHCAQPLMHALGVEGVVRASFAAYNTIEECDRFLAALHRVIPMLE